MCMSWEGQVHLNAEDRGRFVAVVNKSMFPHSFFCHQVISYWQHCSWHHGLLLLLLLLFDALLSAGVTFDSGGISIKPAVGMPLMKGDMGGAACVAATMLATATLNLPIKYVD